MLRITLAVSFVLLSPSMASAFCVSQPDNAATGYVANNTAQTLCLQQELALEAQRAAEQAKINAAIGNLQIQLDGQRLRMIQQQPMGATWPTY